jgi:HPt (histidine-containing phosphotransfer) domain-containing protein
VLGQRGCPADIRRALDGGDWAAAERLAHTARGLSGNIGAVRVPAQAQALEDAIGNGSPGSKLTANCRHSKKAWSN